jgi:hypothetical protein
MSTIRLVGFWLWDPEAADLREVVVRGCGTIRVLPLAAALQPTTMHSPASAAQSLWYFEPHPGHLNDVALPISLRQRGQTLEAMAGIPFQLSALGGARSVAP